MTYQPNIPLATDFISVSQQDINNNFTSLQTAFDTNHVDFNAAGAGKHKFVQLTQQGASPATAGTDTALYSLLTGGLSQLFYRPQANGTAQQITTVPITSAANPGTAGGTVVFFDTIFGIRIYTGQTATIASSAPGKTVTFPSAFTTLLTGIASADDPNAIAVSCAATTAGLTLRPANSCKVNWFAIGRI